MGGIAGRKYISILELTIERNTNVETTIIAKKSSISLFIFLLYKLTTKSPIDNKTQGAMEYHIDIA